MNPDVRAAKIVPSRTPMKEPKLSVDITVTTEIGVSQQEYGHIAQSTE